MQIPPPSPPPPSGGWSIHSRLEITDKYDILDRVGSGAYSDVYRGRRLSDGLAVALKEVHDHQSAAREADSLRALRGCPNVISLLDCFWRDDDAVVFVLEFLHTDLAAVIREARRNRGCGGGDGMPPSEVKRWMLQILEGVEACHRSFILHRDLKPSNLLVSADGVLKLADFGQARVLLPDSTFDPAEDPENHSSSMVLEQGLPKQQEPVAVLDQSFSEHSTFSMPEETTRGEAVNTRDGNASLYTTSKSTDDDYELDNKGEEHLGVMTSCVGTRWYRAPELLYGSERYGTEIDLWSLGCIFAELLSLQPLFPGESDIDQLSRIINVLGDLNEGTWSGCSTLPDYGKIFFGKVENPLGLESCLPNRSASEVSIVKRLVCYEPLNRATAGDLIQDKYFNEEPLPVPANELRVPSSKDLQDDDSPMFWSHQSDSSDSDFDYGGFDVSNTSTGFSIRFS